MIYYSYCAYDSKGFVGQADGLYEDKALALKEMEQAKSQFISLIPTIQMRLLTFSTISQDKPAEGG